MKILFIDRIFSPSKLSIMLKNKFGFYVVSKCVNLMNENKKEEIKSFLVSETLKLTAKERENFEKLINLMS